MHDNNSPPSRDEGDAGDDRLPARADGARLPVKVEPEFRALGLLQEKEAAADEIDLLSYWKILVRRRWLIFACVIVAVILSLLTTLTTTPLYRATAVIQIDKQGQSIVSGGEVGVTYGGWDPAFMTTHIGMLQSRALAERVASDLRVGPATLQSLAPRSWMQRVRALVSPSTSTATAATGEDPDEESDDTAAAHDQEAINRMAAGLVRGGLMVRPRPESRLVDITHISPNPQFSARVANAVADGYIAFEIDRRFGASSYAKDYLEQQLAVAKERLEGSERTLVEFAQKESLVDLGAGESLVGRNLAELNSSLAQAQAQRIRAQSRWAQAGSDSTLPSDILSASLVPTLRAQHADVKRRYEEQLQVFKPDYPDMLRLKGQADELERQIKAEYAAARASLRAEYDAAVTNETMLKNQLAALRAETLDTDSRSIQYNILRREADTNRQLYDSLLQRYQQIGAASELLPNNITVVDRAMTPYAPFSPNLMRNLILALMVGLIFGIALAILIELLDDTIKTAEDIETRLRLAVLGIIPKVGAKHSVERVAADPRSAFSEAYRSVRTALQFSTDQGVPSVLVITSSGPAEGKSTSSLLLARNIAQLGKKVLLIEGDLRSPSLHRFLGQRAEKGLSNLLAGNATLAEVVMPGSDGGPDVILAGPLPPNPAELLAGPRLRALLKVALNDYDQVIIDGPPVLGIADAPLLAHCGGATLLVVQCGRTKIRDAQAAMKRLLATRTRLIGAMLTMYDARKAGHAYQYEGYYAYGGATPRRIGRQ